MHRLPIRAILVPFLLLAFYPGILIGVTHPCNVLILGDSITAGYGVTPGEAYPARLQQKIRFLDWPFEVINGGLSGETTAGGRRRIPWMLRTPVDVFIVALGGNDALRGIPPVEIRDNLEAIVHTVRKSFPHAVTVIVGMEAPPNMGKEYRTAFREAFRQAAKTTHSHFIPFLLQGVAAVPELNQADGIHPNARGHEKIAEYLWRFLKPLLQNLVQSHACPIHNKSGHI